MKTIITAAVFAASIAGSASAETSACVVNNFQSQRTILSGKDQRLSGFDTPWHKIEVLVAPDWMRFKPGVSDTPGWQTLELWGVPRARSHKVDVRFTLNKGDTTVCTTNMSFRP